MSLKKTLTALGLISLISLGSMGVIAGQYKDGNHEPNFTKMAEKLELNENQTAEFITIMEAHREQSKPFRDQLRLQKKQTKEALSAILTEEQLKKFEKKHRRHKH